MSSTPEFNKEQLTAARAQRWHQDGVAMLTLEDAQAWVGELGLVLFAPRGQQLGVPAASLVEATLGHVASAPTAAETNAARGFVARMTAEGAGVPLNLLGGPGDVPDFVVSAQVFSYVFTLRGDKLWKQAPATSGALKVSLLAAKVYETLAAGSALTAADLASELGREVTEAAIGRALVELWAQLRVIPLLQQDGTDTKGSGTLWELTSRRFTKAMKAGANAGQPTALSALISMYLAQAYAATEEEIETFLSPLAARSRVRDVLHGLTGARQLETVAVDGKTLLYIPGALPEFPAAAVAEPVGEGVEPVAEPVKKVGTGRIRRFEGERKAPSEFRGKPARSFAKRRPDAAGAQPPARFGARAEGRSDRERRPFKREGAAGGAKRSFTKPWDEERRPRTASAGAPDSFKKFRKPGRDERKPLGDREQAGLPAERRVFSKPRFERESKARDFAKRPYTPRESGGERGGSKPRSFERKEVGEAKPRFNRGSKPGGFGAKRSYTPRTKEGGKRSFAKRPYTPRTDEGGAHGSVKPRFDRGSKPGGFGAKRPYKPRTEEGSQRSFPKRPYKASEERSSDRSGTTAGKSFGAKRFGAKPVGRFEGKPRFADKSKFGERPKFGSRPVKGKTGFGTKPGFGGKRGGAKSHPDAKKARPKKDERRPEAEE